MKPTYRYLLSIDYQIVALPCFGLLSFHTGSLTVKRRCVITIQAREMVCRVDISASWVMIL